MSVAGSCKASVAPLRCNRRSSACNTSSALSLTGKTLPVDSTFVGTPSTRKNSTVSRGLKFANAECKNLPFAPKASMIPRLSQSCVTLQRVPPDMRILTPAFFPFSSSSTRRPRSAAKVAANSPAAPAPRMTAS
jgi:hypothetical protein